MRNESEYVAAFLKEVILSHYDKMSDHVHLYICENMEGSDEWHCLSEDRESAAALAEMLCDKDGQGVRQNADIKAGENIEYILYGAFKDEFQDSRLNGDGGSKKVWWIWAGDTIKESLRLILKIFTDEMLDKIEDMLYLERIWELGRELNGNISEKTEKLKENKTYQYFFGNIMDKEWLNTQYVKLALREYGLPDWKTFLEISALFYEKRTISTHIFFLEKDEEIQAQYILQFDVETRGEQVGKLDIENRRTIRKLMELSGPEHGLAVRKAVDIDVGEGIEKTVYTIEGIVNNEEMEGKNSIEFKDHLVWRLKKGKEILFEYRDGQYKLLELEVEDKDDIDTELEKLRQFPCSQKEQERIIDTVKKIKEKSNHGTSIVFMDDTTLGEETKRLGRHNRAYQVEMFDLSDLPARLPGILAIDGAILAGMDCCSSVIGVIVDGDTITKGNSGRGARYNSLVNYVHVVKERELKRKAEGRREEVVFCCAVIISEDRMINVEIP